MVRYVFIFITHFVLFYFVLFHCYYIVCSPRYISYCMGDVCRTGAVYTRVQNFFLFFVVACGVVYADDHYLPLTVSCWASLLEETKVNRYQNTFIFLNRKVKIFIFRFRCGWQLHLYLLFRQNCQTLAIVKIHACAFGEYVI